MPTSVRRFTAQLRAGERRLTVDEVVTLRNRVMLEALQTLVNLTRVDTGRARANWQITHNAIPTEATETTDPAGGATIAAGTAAILAISQPSGVVSATNNVNYIEFLELGTERNRAFPMLAPTVQRLLAVFA